MKKISFFACALSAMLIGFSACSEEERKIDNGGQGQGGGNGSSVEEKGTHFDIWVSLGESTGMGSDGATCLVKSVDSLTVQEPINFKNDGVDVTATIYQESVIKDGYYYQVPKSADRFGKYRIADNRLETLAEHPFEQNTYKDRRYTHAWDRRQYSRDNGGQRFGRQSDMDQAQCCRHEHHGRRRTLARGARR